MKSAIISFLPMKLLWRFFRWLLRRQSWKLKIVDNKENKYIIITVAHSMQKTAWEKHLVFEKWQDFEKC